MIDHGSKATNVKVSEAEEGLISLNTYLDKIASRSRQVPRYSEVLCLAKERLYRKKDYRLGEEGARSHSNVSQRRMV